MSLAERIAIAKKRVATLKQEVQVVRESKLTAYKGIKSCLSGPSPPLISSLSIRKVLKVNFQKVYALSWSVSKPGDILSASQDGKLILWDTYQGLKKQMVPLRSAWVMSCDIEPTNGNLVACGGLDNLCSVYNLTQTDGPIVRTHRELVAHDGYLSCCRFYDESSLITSSGDKTLMRWDVEMGRQTQVFSDHEGDVMCVSILPEANPNLFASGSCDNLAKAWDLRTGKSTITFRGHESDINSVCLFPDGFSFGTGSDDASCRIYDIRSCGEVCKFQNDNIVCGVTSVAFSKSGRILFAGYDDYNCLGWDVLGDVGAKHCLQMQGHENRVSCLGVSVDGCAVATGSWDSSLKIWA